MSNRVKIKSKDLLKKAARPERIFPLMLRGDLIARQQELEMRLTEYREELGLNITESVEAHDIAQQIHDLEAEAEDSTLHLRLRALTNTAWRQAVAEHPDEDDEDGGGDLDAICDAVLPDSIVEVRVGKDGDPETLDADDIADLREAMTHAQLNALKSIIIQLNGRDNSVPFSQIGSLILQNSVSKSKQPEDSESASDDTKAGNPDE